MDRLSKHERNQDLLQYFKFNGQKELVLGLSNIYYALERRNSFKKTLTE